MVVILDVVVSWSLGMHKLTGLSYLSVAMTEEFDKLQRYIRTYIINNIGLSTSSSSVGIVFFNLSM